MRWPRSGRPPRLNIRLAEGLLLVSLCGTLACGVLDDGTRVGGARLPTPTARGRLVAQHPTEPPTPTFVPTQSAATPSTPEPSASPEPPLPSTGRVVYEGVDGLSLRDAPNQNKVAGLLKGSTFTIGGEPRDQDGFRWWPAQVEPGWIAEGPGDASQPRWLAPVSGDQIQAGGQARVIYAGEEGMNLRRSPGVAGDLIAALARDSTMTITGEAQMIGAVRWWPVRLNPGWVAEGPSDGSQPRWIEVTTR
jgi:hypothetical protein